MERQYDFAEMKKASRTPARACGVRGAILLYFVQLYFIQLLCGFFLKLLLFSLRLRRDGSWRGRRGDNRAV